MITAEEVVWSLPMLLKEHPALKMELYGILSEEFVVRREFYEFMKKSDERFERLLQAQSKKPVIYQRGDRRERRV